MARWVDIMIEGAEIRQDICERMAMGVLRSNIVPELKTYLDFLKANHKS